MRAALVVCRRTAFAALIWAALGAAFLCPVIAEAQSPQSCARRVDILRHLGGNFHEQPVAIGLADNGNLMEILASEDGKTWSLLFSTPSGISCLIAAGKDWQALPRLEDVGRGL